jgi:hypothetical protein
MLNDFIAVNRDEIIRRCGAKVATRPVPPPTDAEINHGRIYARNLPERGCVVTVDLPRLPIPAAAHPLREPEAIDGYRPAARVAS